MESSPSTLKSLSKLLKSLFFSAFSKLFPFDEPINLTPVNYSPKTPYDYNCPAAVRVFNLNKKDGVALGFKSPKEIAQKVLEQIGQYPPFVEKIEVNEQGFFGIKIKESHLEGVVDQILKEGVCVKTEEKKKIAVDFSSPNIAKEMHVGHLRSTIIGESICRILEFNGHDVLRINHLGDWGTQFGMLINYMYIAYPDFATKMPNLSDLTSFYKAAKEMFDKDPDFKKKSQETVVLLQSGDPDCLKAWNMLCDISRMEFNKIYKRLSIKVEECGESFYNSRIPGTIKECEDKGLVKLDKGAKCIFLEGFEIPLMVIKSDGGFNYDSTDLAAIRYRVKELNVQRIIYITDSGQLPHFQMIFAAAKLMGWLNPPHVDAQHMGFGVVLGEDGKKLKTRKGALIKLNDLLDEAYQKAYDGLISRLKENKEGSQTNLQNEEEIKLASEKIGMAAIKYYDLKQNRISDYKFEYEKMLDFKGNTAVYLLYSYVRLSSIIAKSGLEEKHFVELANKGFKITHPHERTLLVLLSRFPETIETVIDELEIHKLCDFIYALATKIAEGYAKYRILDDPNKDTRILLCEAMRRVLKQSFYLVGIEPIDRI